MNIAIIDEDDFSVPILADLLRKHGHNVHQIPDWKKLESELPPFAPDALLLDLMMPAIDLPTRECNGGYTTGAYIYEHCIRDLAAGVPFILLTSADLQTPVIRHSIERLRRFGECRGALAKGVSVETILATLNVG